jgi:[ribosomal protein S18]-alanine N-acetyltransferase
VADCAVSIRIAGPDDLPFIAAIENDSFTDPWTERHFTEDECLVAVQDGQVVGFLVFRLIDVEEGEILNLAVRSDCRRTGVASALLRWQLHQSREQSRNWFLEVRESNYAAQALYRLFDFQEVGRRPRYYRNPTESAIVMRR